MVHIVLLILTGFLALPSSARALGPEWDHIKVAEQHIRGRLYFKAEYRLKKALGITRDEPKIFEDLALVHIAFNELSKAKKHINKAVEIAERKARKQKGEFDGRKAWDRYLADLYSTRAELVILENEKTLRPQLMGKGDPPSKAKFDAALGRVRRAVLEVRKYGDFRSIVDDKLIERTLAAVAEMEAEKKEASSKPSGEAAGASPFAEEAGAVKGPSLKPQRGGGPVTEPFPELE